MVRAGTIQLMSGYIRNLFDVTVFNIQSVSFPFLPQEPPHPSFNANLALCEWVCVFKLFIGIRSWVRGLKKITPTLNSQGLFSVLQKRVCVWQLRDSPGIDVCAIF